MDTKEVVVAVKEERKVGLDILRSVSMFLIVLWHFLYHGEFIANATGINLVLQNILHCVFLVAVNVFVLISGYFLSCSDKPFKFKKFLNLVLQASFYGVVIYVVFCFIGYEQFSFYSLYKNLFPFLTNRYWFLTTYLILYLASPFLNMIVKDITKKQFAFLFLGILLLCLCLENFGITGTLHLDNGYSILWFIILYLIAGGVRKFNLFNIKSWCLIIIYFVSLILFVCKKSFYIFSESYILKYLLNLRLTYDGFLVLISSVCLIVLFARMKQLRNKKMYNIIKIIASTCFGVYLLHDNNYVRSKIYANWFAVKNFYTNNYSTLYLILFTIITFIVCMVIDLLRQLLDRLIRKTIIHIKNKQQKRFL